MAGKRITVEIGRDGTMRASTSNVKGPDCLAELPTIEALCGGVVIDSSLTGDYYEQQEATSTLADTVTEQQELGHE